ncbi:MAG: TonB-dependent receptor [Crocinitomicaceae bacterium]|nr:TonB-dependent receptor [Crocinitomicaceae bacterium]MDP4738620.1 TonB-dependent receptor [Crocinitomicaceae bacterium]MDP4798582.1 TonB-dependent receptor [Crocinitomicaceae bacterium]MDP4806780.1 TonB-dependent receptor [Crocinitomicaceae bacterium]MDP4867279.1 TonB-dependent receptor [Crocinitomicaceae bacterium]
MKSILLFLFIGLTNLLWVQAQTTIELRDAYTFESVNGPAFKTQAKLSQQTNALYLIESAQFPLTIEITHPDYEPYLLVIPYSGSAVAITVYLVPNAQTENETVVSANKSTEKRKDVAQKIQVIRAAEIQFQQQTSMADVLANSGSVFVQKSQLGGGSPIIRGFETNKVLLVVDGIRMNNAIFRGGHLQNVLTLDQANLDRAEVLFGPGSVIYGSDAIGGVMSFQTKKPVFSTSDQLLVRSAAYMRGFSAGAGYAANAQVNVGSKRWASLTSISYSNFGDLRQGKNRSAAMGNLGFRPWYVAQVNGQDSMVVNADSSLQVGSGYTQYDVLQKLSFIQKPGVQHHLNLQLSNSGNIDRYDRLTLMSGTKPKFAEWYYGPQYRLLAAYTLELSNATKFYDNARIILAYQGIEESRIDRRFQKASRNHRIEQLDIYTLNADFMKKWGAHELRYGAEAYLNKVNSTAFAEDINTGEQTTIDTRYPDGGSSMQGAALYASHTFEVSDKLIINDGIRFSQVGLQAQFIDQTFFPFPFSQIQQNHLALNGNLGLIYMPQTKLRISINVSTAFRAPNVDDLTKVFESVPGSVIVPNPELLAEYAYNAELGLQYQFMKKSTIGVNLYQTYLTNALTVQNGTFNGADSVLYDGQMSQVLMTTNKGRAYVRGFEAFLQAQLTPSLQLSGTYNFTIGRILTDSVPYPLDHIAPAFGKVSLRYAMLHNKLKLEGFMLYAGWKRLDDYNFVGEDNFAYATADGMPSWYTLNLRANYNINNQLSIQVACENILDRNYRMFASNISAPGRNFILTLRGNF